MVLITKEVTDNSHAVKNDDLNSGKGERRPSQPRAYGTAVVHMEQKCSLASFVHLYHVCTRDF